MKVFTIYADNKKAFDDAAYLLSELYDQLVEGDVEGKEWNVHFYTDPGDLDEEVEEDEEQYDPTTEYDYFSRGY